MSGEFKMVPASEPCTLAACPTGLFMADSGALCFKSEYGDNSGRIDAYIVSSGEFFWGSAPQTVDNQRREMVRPVEVAAAPAPAEAVPVAWQRKSGNWWVDVAEEHIPFYRDKQKQPIRALYAGSPPPTDAEAVRRAAEIACDLLAEHIYGSPARSPAHNARLVLERALAGKPPATEGWRPIETAPKDGRMILLYNEAHDEQVVAGWTAGPYEGFHPNGFWSDAGSKNAAINAMFNPGYFQRWQPLPAPPARGGEDA